MYFCSSHHFANTVMLMRYAENLLQLSATRKEWGGPHFPRKVTLKHAKMVWGTKYLDLRGNIHVGRQSSNNSSGWGVVRCEHALKCLNGLGKWLDQYFHNIKPLKAKKRESWSIELVWTWFLVHVAKSRIHG